MGDNITASAAVSEASVSEIKDSEGVIAELEAENEALKAEIEELKENEAFKNNRGTRKAVTCYVKPEVNPTRSLFFDHDVLSDTGMHRKYIPRLKEYERLKPRG